MPVHPKVTPHPPPSILSGFPDNLPVLYSWEGRGTVKVKCITQEYNTLTCPVFESGTLNPGISDQRPLPLSMWPSTPPSAID